MGERITIAALLGRTLLACAMLAGAGAATRAQNPPGGDLQVLMADAQEGIAEAQYRLGQYYEAQYAAARRDPETAADYTSLLLAYGWFQSAEKAGHGDARYARIATDHALKETLNDVEYRLAMETVAEWMRDQVSSPPPEPPSEPTIVGAETPAADDPPEALTELAAGDEPGDATPAMAEPPERETPPAPEKPAGPTVEELLARGTSYLEAGDLISARGFFKMAAGEGSGEAAMLVGVTYDPGYMELRNVVGLRPDAEQAAAWYLRAVEMNIPEAESRLQALKRRLDRP
jgi:TPR repeat protein